MHLTCARLALLGFGVAVRGVLGEVVTHLPVPFSIYDWVDGDVEGYIAASDSDGRTTYILSDSGKFSHTYTSHERTTANTRFTTRRLTDMEIPSTQARGDGLRTVTYTLGGGSAVATLTDDDTEGRLYTIMGDCAFRSGNSGRADCHLRINTDTFVYSTDTMRRRVVLQDPPSNPIFTMTGTGASPVITTTQPRGGSPPLPKSTVTITVPEPTPGADPTPGASPTADSPGADGVVASIPSTQTTAPPGAQGPVQGPATVLPSGDADSPKVPSNPDVTTVFVTGGSRPSAGSPASSTNTSTPRGGEAKKRPSRLIHVLLLGLVLRMM